MKGRKRLPQEIAGLRGRRHRRKEDNAPVGKTAPIGEMEPPSFLRPAAKHEWCRVTNACATLGMLTDTDIPMLVSWCSAVADLADAEQHLRHGLIAADRDGNERRSPWLMVKARAVDQLAKLADHFGFSPSGRTRLRIIPEKTRTPGPDEEPPLEDFLAELRALQ